MHDDEFPDSPAEWGRKDVVYHWDQCITHNELHAIYDDYQQMLSQCKWYQLRAKNKLKTLMYGVELLVVWLHGGKPSNPEDVK